MLANREGRIFGRTTRGDFLSLNDGSIVFLSFEQYAGPLTANIERDPVCRPSLQTGDLVQFDDNGILFPDCGWRLTWPAGPAWSSPRSELSPQPYRRITATLHRLAADLFAIKPPEGLASNLALWLTLPNDPPAPPLNIDLELFRQKEFNTNGLLEFFDRFIGRGKGLTPSGDDLIQGFLLAASRWPGLLTLDFDFPALSGGLIEEAYRRTTRLSAGLIECATKGQADERLIRAVDGIATGEISQSLSATELACWGNHSGSDALTGMGLYFLTVK